MERFEFETLLDDLMEIPMQELGTTLSDMEDEDLLKVFKIIRLTRKAAVEYNNDIEEIKESIENLNNKIDMLLTDVKGLKNRGI